MEKVSLENEVIDEMAKLMEKTGFSCFAQTPIPTDTESSSLETALINLKSINARYEKHDAIVHVRALMNKYNIQIDELMEQLK